MFNTLEVSNMEELGRTIASTYFSWDNEREEKKAEWSELEDYLYQTDTKKTAGAKLPWSNTTTIPKLSQIRDNLRANYYSALIPNRKWLDWDSRSEDGLSFQKKNIILSVMRDKTDNSQFRKTLGLLIDDYVMYGNAIATVEYVKEEVEDDFGKRVKYIGPRLVRINPLDIVFNPLATSFESSPKIIRVMKTMGDLVLESQTMPENGFSESEIENMRVERNSYGSQSPSYKREQTRAYGVQGFGNMAAYYQSGFVELLEFYGNVYDRETGTLHRNVNVTVADGGKTVIRFREVESWMQESYFKHIGWRERQSNLWASGPLDQLVGMQYRIDNLENTKADIMDMTAMPITALKGNVKFKGFAPGAKAILGEDGDLKFINVNSNVLDNDNVMQNYMNLMEMFAGAPSEAMGIRTPGEKTAYEVQALESKAQKMFQSKVNYFEEHFLEPLLNSMFEVYRRNLDTTDLVRMFDEENGIYEFMSISRQDISDSGNFRALGARHFAEKAKKIQELTQFMQTVGTNQLVTPHISGKAVAKTVLESLDLLDDGLYEENIAVVEQAETQKAASIAQQSAEEVASVPLEEDMMYAEQEAEEEMSNAQQMANNPGQ